MRYNINVFLFLTVLLLISCDLDQTDTSWSKHFHKLIEGVKNLPMKKIAVAAAEDDFVLEAIKIAKEEGLAESILVGDEKKIRDIAKTINMDLSQFEVINEPEPASAAKVAVKLVHDGVADMYMKGLISTKDFLRSVLDKEVGLRTGRVLTHVGVFEVKGIDQLLFLSDQAFIMYPTLEEKIKIIENALDIANACGIKNPKVAPLAAVEVVNPKMPATVDAAELTKMNNEGKIKGCIIDGPLSLDMAISKEACSHKKGLDRKITGDADILLFPDIHTGNVAYKMLVHTAHFLNGAILSGTSAPVILTSRSDSVATRVNSIALASVLAEHIKKNKKPRIAIVGAGPAGLTAAKELLKKKFVVDIYEKENFAGGVMSFGIPAFRINYEKVKKFIDPVVELGGTFYFGEDLKESDFLELAKKYDYVYLAFGLTKVRHLGIPGDEIEGSLNALEFLRQFNFDDKLGLTHDKPKLHGTVIVVGAGNVAMDGARCAVRSGADKTIILYRRDRSEAPCTKSEMIDAEKDGVELKFLSNPVELISENNKLKAVKYEVMVLGDKDESGRRRPVGTGKFETINADYIISAIGQIPDESVWNAGVIETDHGYIKGIKNYGEAFETSVSNIFTGGDIIKGAKTIGVASKCGRDFASYVISEYEKTK
jgi:phosphate butyryltransferase